MPRKRTPQLTEAEQRVMTVLWERGESNVRDVTEALKADHNLAYTTILTTIRIMADKGYVGFRKEGRTHIYRPLVTRERAQKKAIGSLLSSLFGGSPQRLAQHLVEDDQLTLEDIEALRVELIARDQSQKDTDR